MGNENEIDGSTVDLSFSNARLAECPACLILMRTKLKYLISIQTEGEGVSRKPSFRTRVTGSSWKRRDAERDEFRRVCRVSGNSTLAGNYS